MDTPAGGWGTKIFSGVSILLILSTSVKSSSVTRSPRLTLMSVLGILPGLEDDWGKNKNNVTHYISENGLILLILLLLSTSVESSSVLRTRLK